MSKLPPEPGESPFSDETAPPPTVLAVHRQIPLVVSDSAVDVDGLSETTFAQDIPGKLRVSIKVQTRVETREHAERVESVLPRHPRLLRAPEGDRRRKDPAHDVGHRSGDLTWER
jgi:hypothetical protein